MLYDLLLSLVPAHKILLGKRVLSIAEDDERVKATTSDNSVYEGDILVGADGAYSAVRQRLYETLKQEGRLPKSDQEDLPFSVTCLVGQTEPLDFEEFPQLKNPGYPFIFHLGGEGRPYTVRFLLLQFVLYAIKVLPCFFFSHIVGPDTSLHEDWI